MKQFFLFFICITGFSNFAISQLIWTDASNKRIMEWDSGYNVEIIEFRSISEYEIPYQYIIRKKNKVVAEYVRHDDSSYLFVRYDTLHNRVQRGLIKICSDTFKIDTVTVQIPVSNTDFGTNKEVFKDSILYDYYLSYRKSGIWKETDSLGMIWKGEYKNGSREGEWKEGTYLHIDSPEGYIIERQNDYFRPLSKHLFKNGVEISSLKDNAFWPKIKGKWFTTLTIIDSNTYLFQRQELGKIYLNFETNSLLTSLRRSRKPVMHLLEKYTAKWKQNGDIIEIIEDGSTKILQVLSFSDNQLILRFLKW